MYWHIDTDFVSLAAMLAIYICSRRMPQQEVGAVRTRRFFRCLEVGMGVTVVDIVASIVMEVPVSRGVYHVAMTAYYALLVLPIVEWLLYVLTILYESHERKRMIVSRWALSVYGVYTLLCLTNPWTGLLYSLGADNTYTRGILFPLMLVLYILYAVLLLALTLIRWRYIPREFSGGVLLLTPLLIGAGIAVQLSMPGWLLILPTYMICELLAFLFFQTYRVRDSQQRLSDLSHTANTDRLTGLLNRAGMEAMVEKTLHESVGMGVVVLLVDIDDLKTINDTMGHAEGDRTIHLVADKLRHHFRAGDTVVRYGGDEFLAFFTGSFDEERINASLERLVDGLRQLRVGPHDDFPIHGSVGAAFGIVGEDSFDALCRRADAALYQVKRRGKNGYTFYSRQMTLR